MKRGLLTLIGWGAAVVLVISIAFWIYTCLYYDVVILHSGRTEYRILAVRGRVIVQVYRYRPEAKLAGDVIGGVVHQWIGDLPAGLLPARADHRFLGIGYGWNREALQSAKDQIRVQAMVQNFGTSADRSEASGDTDRANTIRAMAARELGAALQRPFFVQLFEVSLWPIVLLSGLVLTWRLRAHLRERRIRLQGMCRVCGYDLRASPGRCPECGTSASTARASA